MALIVSVSMFDMQEFPITSKLDVVSYGNNISAIAAVQIEPFMDGMDAQQVILLPFQ